MTVHQPAERTPTPPFPEQQQPIGRPAQPAELAPLYVFLASEESSYLAGEIVGATGGEPLP